MTIMPPEEVIKKEIKQQREGRNLIIFPQQKMYFQVQGKRL